MVFEWGEAKDRENLAKHGIGFAEAVQIFERWTLSSPDDRFDYGEERVISVGLMRTLVVVVVTHTARDESIRIISARKATKQEKRTYDAGYARQQQS